MHESGLAVGTGGCCPSASGAVTAAAPRGTGTHAAAWTVVAVDACVAAGRPGDGFAFEGPPPTVLELTLLGGMRRDRNSMLVEVLLDDVVLATARVRRWASLESVRYDRVVVPGPAWWSRPTAARRTGGRAGDGAHLVELRPWWAGPSDRLYVGAVLAGAGRTAPPPSA